MKNINESKHRNISSEERVYGSSDRKTRGDSSNDWMKEWLSSELKIAVLYIVTYVMLLSFKVGHQNRRT